MIDERKKKFKQPSFALIALFPSGLLNEGPKDSQCGVKGFRGLLLETTAKILIILAFYGGGRVVRRCWVNFQCRGVLQF